MSIMQATDTAAKPVLTECRLVIDGLTGDCVLHLNGEQYSVSPLDEHGADFLRLTGRKPRDLWTVKDEVCNCPAFRFNAHGCKHIEALKTGILGQLARTIK